MNTLTKIIFQQRGSHGIFDLSSLYPESFQKILPVPQVKIAFASAGTLKNTALAHPSSYMLPSLLPHTSKRCNSGLPLLLPSVESIQQDLKIRKDLYNSQFDFIYADMFLQLSSDLIHITKIQKSKQ